MTRHGFLDPEFAVSAADDSISGVEEAQIRQIASELGFSLEELVQIRSSWNDKREILRRPGAAGVARAKEEVS